MRRKVDQIEMFQRGEDLPLFSGTAQRAQEFSGPAQGQSANADHLAGFGCLLCYDTGVVTVDGQRRFCTCPAGAEARREARQRVPTLYKPCEMWYSMESPP